MLFEEAREAPVLQGAAAGLALRAVVDRVLLEVDAGERRPAAGAWLAEAVVHAIHLAVLPAVEAQLEPPCELVPDRRREPLGLLLVDLRRELVGREPSPPRGSRSPRRARSRRSAAGRGAASAAAASPTRGSARRLRSRAGRPPGRDARAPRAAASGRSSHTPARFFEPASVSCSSPPSAKRSRNIGVFAPFAAGGDVLEPPGAHQMHHQDELAVGGRQQEPLGAPLDAAEALPVERGDRRVERLQRGDVRRARRARPETA